MGVVCLPCICLMVLHGSQSSSHLTHTAALGFIVINVPATTYLHKIYFTGDT